MTNKEIAQQIVKEVGGENNIQSLTHCVTRLRFVLKDENQANQRHIEQLEGILGVQKQAGQFQVIVGNKVNKLYDEILKIVDIKSEGIKSNHSNKSKISTFLETISSILIPSLPPVIGGGMIKGFLFMFWQFGWIEWGSEIFNLLNIISDGMFYFYPFLLAVSAAKRFKTNMYMALAIAGSLMHPTMYEGIGAAIDSFKVFNFLNIPYLDYSASVIPIILSVWLMSYVYRFFEKHIPEIVSIIFTPMLTLLVMVPISLAAIAPIGFYFGEYLAQGVEALINFSPIVSGFVIGALRPLMVFTGTHHAIRAIVAQQLASSGATTIGAMNYMSTMAQAAAPLAVYLILRKRNKKMRDISLSAAISGFLGVTEPALYGVIVKYKVALLAVCIGGGVGSAISATFGGAEYAMVMSSIVTIPATFGDGFIGIAIGLPVSIIVTMLIIFLLKNHLIKEDDMTNKTVPINTVETTKVEVENNIVTIYSPVAGEVCSLRNLPDDTFAKEMVGKGVAIIPNDTTIYAPVDGIISAIFPTKHAIGITSNEGVEILIHIGINTVNLNGQYFTSTIQVGQKIQVGQELLTFDKEGIKKENYNCDVIVVVTNAKQYLDIFPNTKLITTKVKDELISVIM